MRPSFLISIISGLVFLYAMIIFILYRNEISDQDFKYVTILILISMFLGIHSLNHANEEIYFNFNPFAGKWKPDDEPKKEIA